MNQPSPTKRLRVQGNPSRWGSVFRTAPRQRRGSREECWNCRKRSPSTEKIGKAVELISMLDQRRRDVGKQLDTLESKVETQAANQQQQTQEVSDIVRRLEQLESTERPESSAWRPAGQSGEHGDRGPIVISGRFCRGHEKLPDQIRGQRHIWKGSRHLAGTFRTAGDAQACENDGEVQTLPSQTRGEAGMPA